MGTTLGSGNQIDITFQHRITALRQPLDSPVHGFLVAGETAGEGFQRHRFNIGQSRSQVIPKTVLVEPLVFLAGLLLQKGHRQSRAKNRLGTKVVAQAADRKIGTVKIFGVRRELQAGTGVALAYGINHFQLGGFVTVGERHPMHLTIPLDGHFQMRGQGIDHGNTHTVQTTGEVVVALGEFTTGVQPGKDKLHPGQSFFLVQIDRHAPTVVLHTQGIVAVQHHINPPGVAGEGLVNAVINDFLGQVVGPRRVGIHPRALAHRIKTAQDFNGIGVVLLLAHRNGTAPQMIVAP